MTALDVVYQYYQYFNTQHWEGMLSCLTPDVRHDANQGGTQTGLDAYRQFLTHMDACYQETLTDLVFMVDAAGTRVACEFTVNGIYKQTDGDLPPATGQSYTIPAGAFLDVKADKISRVTTYYNLPLWIQLISA